MDAKRIEDLLVYAGNELFLSEEGQAYARNQLLELLQIEPSEGKGEYPKDIFSLLGEISSCAVKNGVIESGNEKKFIDKLLGFIMPSIDDAAHTFMRLHRDGKTDEARDYFRRLATASLYVESGVSDAIGWFGTARMRDFAIMIPEKNKKTFSATYPICEKCVENVGFFGYEDESYYTKRVLPIDAGGNKWYFSYEKTAYVPEEFCLASATHTVRDKIRPLAVMADFLDYFPSYFICGRDEEGGHEYFSGGRSVLPCFECSVKALSKKDGVTVAAKDWILPTLEVSGEDKDEVVRYATVLSGFCKKRENARCAVLARKVENGYCFDLIFGEEEEASSPYLYAGLFVLPSETYDDVVALTAELTKEKIDFAKISEDKALGKYFDFLMQTAAVKGLKMPEEKAREAVLGFITNQCAEKLTALACDADWAAIFTEGLKEV